MTSFIAAKKIGKVFFCFAGSAFKEEFVVYVQLIVFVTVFCMLQICIKLTLLNM